MPNFCIVANPPRLPACCTEIATLEMVAEVVVACMGGRASEDSFGWDNRVGLYE